MSDFAKRGLHVVVRLKFVLAGKWDWGLACGFVRAGVFSWLKQTVCEFG